MAEKGSDEELRSVADWSATIAGVAEEEVRNDDEEARLDGVKQYDVDEPGKEYPDPAPPPDTEAHDEFDPVPA